MIILLLKCSFRVPAISRIKKNLPNQSNRNQGQRGGGVRIRATMHHTLTETFNLDQANCLNYSNKKPKGIFNG